MLLRLTIVALNVGLKHRTVFHHLSFHHDLLHHSLVVHVLVLLLQPNVHIGTGLQHIRVHVDTLCLYKAVDNLPVLLQFKLHLLLRQLEFLFHGLAVLI